MTSRSVVVTEPFTLAQDPLTTNWAQTNNGWGNVVAGGANVSGSGNSSDSGQIPQVVWNGAGSFTDDQYAKATITGIAFNGTGRRAGVAVRDSGQTNAARDSYVVTVLDDGTSGTGHTTALGKIVNGTYTQLTTTANTWSNGDTIALEVEGTSLRCYRNDVLIAALSTTDAALSTGKPGVTVTSDMILDDFEGGNLITVVGPQVGVITPVGAQGAILRGASY